MNIQQALNNSLSSAAFNLYLTGETLKGNEQSAIAESRAATDNALEKYADLVNEKSNFAKHLQEGDSPDEAWNKTLNSVRGQEATLSKKRLERAQKELKKWAPNEADDYNKLTRRKVDDLKQNVTEQLLGNTFDSHNDSVEAEALRSQQRQQETYTNQNQTMRERINILSGMYQSRMHQPSVSKEV